MISYLIEQGDGVYNITVNEPNQQTTIEADSLTEAFELIETIDYQHSAIMDNLTDE